MTKQETVKMLRKLPRPELDEALKQLGDIPKNVWHNLESLESGSVIFECKEVPFVEHEVEGVLEVKNVK
jgi:hypothetical protein